MKPNVDGGNDGSSLPSGAPKPREKALGKVLHLQAELPVATIIKIFAAILFAVVAYKLWSFILLLLLSLFVAVSLHPVVEWLESKHVKRWVSLLLVIGTLLTVLGASIALLIPALVGQLAALTKSLPTMREAVLAQFPADSFVRESLNRLSEMTGWSEMGAGVGHLVSMGSIALGSISEFLLIIVVAVYFLIDGSKTFEWFLAFFSPIKRAKLRSTAEEVAQVIFGYVAGQAITSALVAVYAFTVLSLLHVPGALMLALLAAVFDVLPIIGFFLAAAPACLLALSVSPSTAFLVAGLYLVYHLIEAYFLVPKIYGESLRLSTLSVLLALLVGGILAGIPGALAVLPFVASYAVVERIWLKPFLGKGVAEKHELQKDEEFGEKEPAT